MPFINTSGVSATKSDSYLRVSIPTMGLSRSGGDRVLIEIANRLARNGHTVTILVSRPHSIFTFPIDPSVRVIRAEKRMSVIMEIAWLAVNIPPFTDVALANYYPTAYSVYASSLLQPLIPLYLIQGYEPDFFRFSKRRVASFVRKIAAVFSYTLPIGHLYVSSWLQGKVAFFGASTRVVVSNGVDSTVFSKGQKDESKNGVPVVMFIGSLAPNKGSHFVVNALNGLAQKHSFKILMVTQFADFRPALSVQVDVQSPKCDSELAQCYRRADIFVFSSIQEGFGLPPLEAMACGASVVCSACGGVEGYAQNEVNCLMVRAGCEEALRNAIERLLLDAGLRKRLALGGYLTASSFSWSRAVGSYERIFQAAAKFRNSRLI